MSTSTRSRILRGPGRRFAGVALVACFAAAPLAAQLPHQQRSAAWSWTGTIPRLTTVEVRIVRGSLRAVSTADSAVTVELVRRAIRSDPLSARLVVDTTAGRIRITDRYRPFAPGARRECLPLDDGRGDFWHSDVRIDAVVHVPHGVRLEVHVMSGDVDLRQLAGPRGASTNDGDVRGAAHIP